MLSGRLIHLIEIHHRQIADRIVHNIERQSDLTHLRRLPEAELREACEPILEHLGTWVAGGDEKLEGDQEELGRRRFDQSVPLHEAVGGLCLVKRHIIEFIEEQGIPQDTLGLYAEEQLELGLCQSFDRMIIHFVRGYEVAWREAVLAAA